MSRFIKDYYFKKAKTDGFRARSAYKLIEANKKFHLIKSGDFVLDIGASPGSWLQAASSIAGSKGFLIGIDVTSIKTFKNKKNIQTAVLDVFDAEFEQKILLLSKGRIFDVILSDAAPYTTGQIDTDQERSSEISERAFEIAEKFLKPDGNIFVKVFEGSETPRLIKERKNRFKIFKIFKPLASKKNSKEIFLVGLGFLKIS